MGFEIDRYHDFCAGHRVAGHESKCAHLHGHNYRVTFHCQSVDGMLDSVSRVIDFSDVKARLCQWLEDNWDHKFLVWERDPLAQSLLTLDPAGVLWVTFNPTAENMARHLVEVIGPQQLKGTGIKLVKVRIEETRKCAATYTHRGIDVYA